MRALATRGTTRAIGQPGGRRAAGTRDDVAGVWRWSLTMAAAGDEDGDARERAMLARKRLGLDGGKRCGGEEMAS